MKIFKRKYTFASVVAFCFSVYSGQICAHPDDLSVRRLEQMGIAPSGAVLVQYAAQGDLAVVTLLLEAGVSPMDPERIRKVTALHNASSQGHIHIVKYLIARGVNIDAQDWNGVTPLIAACTTGQIEIVKLLLKYKASVDIVPLKAPTALIAAIQAGRLDIVQVLLVAGATPSLADSFGTTPMEAALTANQAAIVGQLKANQ